MAFVDEARIHVNAGDGGKGCESFYRDRYMRHPRPDGGDGGKGGDILFRADSRIQTLLDYRFRQHYKAQRGGHGGSKGKTGKRGENCLLKVPVGTILRDHETGLLIRDLASPGQEVLVAKGGQGGQGNKNNRTPTLPESGESKVVHLELKLIADVGLVGFPNAGKSTLVSAVSKVRSRVAKYPFTTKQPILGVVKRGDVSFIIADLPGLIEGAHAGKGLGDRFLKHAERTKILVHIIDMAATEGRDPWEDHVKIENELQQYSDLLSFKQRVVVANKMDLPEAEGYLKDFRQKYKGPLIEISALQSEGLETFLERVEILLLAEGEHGAERERKA